MHKSWGTVIFKVKILLERFYKVCLSSVAIPNSISFKISNYWYALSILLKKLLRSRALVFSINYTKEETTSTITLNNATFVICALPFIHFISCCQLIFLKPCHPSQCPCIIFYFSVINLGTRNRLILCAHHSRILQSILKC